MTGSVGGFFVFPQVGIHVTPRDTPMTTKNRKTLADRAKAFLARHGGNAEAAIAQALSDLGVARARLKTIESGEMPYKPDARIGELEREVADSETEIDRLSGLIPPTGAIVLTGDDAKAYTDYKALGTPADLKKQIDELPTLRTKISDSDTKSAGEQAAQLLGWNRAATTAAIADKKLVVSFVAGKDAKGADIKIPHVRPASDDKAVPTPLADYVKANAEYLMPSLTAKDAAATGTPVTPITTPFFSQSSTSMPSTTGDAVADFAKSAQAARDARPNQLFPKPQAAAS
jgi:hypothetical protein